jgi:hypothetical protein
MQDCKAILQQVHVRRNRKGRDLSAAWPGCQIQEEGTGCGAYHLGTSTTVTHNEEEGSKELVLSNGFSWKKEAQ